ncbi:MAG: hypothetical protein WBO35_00550 [Candidatus Saccharimonadales bacterium]
MLPLHKRLADEMLELGLIRSDHHERFLCQPPDAHDDTRYPRDLISATKKLGRSTNQVPQNFQPTMALGKVLCQATQDGVTTYQELPPEVTVPFDRRYTTACAAAENTFVDVLAEHRTLFPLLVTDKKTAVGLIKPDGDPTMLATKTIGSLGLYAGMIYLPRKSLGPASVTKPYSVEADQLDLVPLRMTTFLLPGDFSLSSQGKKPTIVSFQSAAKELQKVAEPGSERVMKILQS